MKMTIREEEESREQEGGGGQIADVTDDVRMCKVNYVNQGGGEGT